MAGGHDAGERGHGRWLGKRIGDWPEALIEAAQVCNGVKRPASWRRFRWHEGEIYVFTDSLTSARFYGCQHQRWRKGDARLTSRRAAVMPKSAYPRHHGESRTASRSRRRMPRAGSRLKSPADNNSGCDASIESIRRRAATAGTSAANRARFSLRRRAQPPRRRPAASRF